LAETSSGFVLHLDEEITAAAENSHNNPPVKTQLVVFEGIEQTRAAVELQVKGFCRIWTERSELFPVVFSLCATLSGPPASQALEWYWSSHLA